MNEPNSSQESEDPNIQVSILNELKRNNELLDALLKIQSNVQQRQRKFWVMAIAQVGILVIVALWWGSKYGF
jgi:preprotein translocase subunit SecB